MSKHSDVVSDGVAEATPAMAAAATRGTWVSVAVNLALSIGQVAVGILSRSQGLVADGTHSLSELIADFLVLMAGRDSRKPVDENHPDGHMGTNASKPAHRSHLRRSC